MRGNRKSVLREDFLDPSHQLLSQFGNLFVNSPMVFGQLPQCCQRSHYTERIGIVCPLMPHLPLRYEIHDVLLTPKTCYRIATTEPFTKYGHIRDNLIVGLRPPQTHSKSRNGLIKNQNYFMFLCNFPKAFQEATSWRNNPTVAHDRLNNQRTNMLAVFRQRILNDLQSIPRNNANITQYTCRLPRHLQDRKRLRLQSCSVCVWMNTDQNIIKPTMIGPLELCNLRFACVGSRQS